MKRMNKRQFLKEHWVGLLLFVLICACSVFAFVTVLSRVNPQTGEYLAYQRLDKDIRSRNYIDLKSARVFCMDKREDVFISIDSTYSAKVEWGDDVSPFYIQIFDKGFEVLPSELRREQAEIPQGTRHLTLDFNAAAKERIIVTVFFSQYDEEKRILAEAQTIAMPFTHIPDSSSSDRSFLYSLGFRVLPESKYYKIQMKIAPNLKNGFFNFNYIDMIWKSKCLMRIE